MSALLAVIGLIAIAAFFAFLIVPGLRYQAHTSDADTILAVQGDSGWLDQTDYLPTRKQIIPPIDPKTVMTPTPELLARGKAVFAQTCATCHGPEGKGDGPGGKGLNPSPRNFTANANWKNGPRIEDIYKTLEEGIKGSSMASYNYLSKKDRMALIHYVQSLGAFDHGKGDPTARAELEKLFSSVGEVIPNRIPVKTAMQLLIQEYRYPPRLRRCLSAAGIRSAIVDVERANRVLSELGPSGETSDTFAQRVSQQVPSNGFAVNVNSMPAERWNQLWLCAGPH